MQSLKLDCQWPVQKKKLMWQILWLCIDSEEIEIVEETKNILFLPSVPLNSYLHVKRNLADVINLCILTSQYYCGVWGGEEEAGNVSKRCLHLKERNMSLEVRLRDLEVLCYLLWVYSMGYGQWIHRALGAEGGKGE